MARDSRFALWLLLPREAQARFQVLISRLSERLGTPVFEPHITLLGGLGGSGKELCARTRALAGAIEPLEVRLQEAICLDEYYRCLFVEVAPSRALHDAHAAARQVFDQRSNAGFYPHLSLVYGDLEEKEKATILNEIGRHFDESIRIEKLALYDTSGPVWRCVERVGLGGGNRSGARAARPG
jgi:2'-5' RNA ligase